MTDNYGDCIAFVVDTDQYAGNFEREMCAHLTGQIGECEVGEEFVKNEIAVQFYNVIDKADDHGTYRPVTIFRDKNNGSYNSVAIFFDKNDPPVTEQITLMKERAATFLQAYKTIGNMAEFHQNAEINILGFRLIEFGINSTEIDV